MAVGNSTTRDAQWTVTALQSRETSLWNRDGGCFLRTRRALRRLGASPLLGCPGGRAPAGSQELPVGSFLSDVEEAEHRADFLGGCRDAE
ncbi:zinc finger protein 664 isoform X2 [Cavia porcellus]|uniref:zinc finger protein 664 isoform X2 n=1 Tax=Cavia porcellus TaxID=10141 RepID=UPI002FE32040